MSRVSNTLADKIGDFVLNRPEISEEPVAAKADPFWQGLADTGSSLWLDTGDIEAARTNWSAEMSALTTNNSLLNKEVQKGIYDDLITEAANMLESEDESTTVMETAFILNALHGMRLTRLFGADVSVELHTDVSYDAEDIVHYGRRFHAINPDRFIVKVPFTPAGILGARRLRESGIRVNLTLGFSARQNAIAALVAKPNFVNVFLGRLNSFVADNNIGSGKMVGEKATLASQRTVTRLTASYETPVRQIAASIRGAGQIEALAGVDVFTMPTHVAEQARSELSGTFKSHVEDDYPVALDDANADEVKLENLWEVGDAVIEFARQIDADPPASGSQVRNAAHEAGCRDLFPRFSEKDLAAISEDGKIPVHERWAKRIASGEVAVDTLMNRAGLATFASDQAALDNRIRDIVS